MIRYSFGAEDLGRVRFGTSPLFDLTASVRVLRAPAGHAIHAPWARVAARRVADLDLELLFAVLPPEGYRPDFVAPPPERPRAELADELERVRATTGDQIAQELDWVYPGGHMPQVARDLIAAPRAGLDRLVDQMRAYWERAIAPWWERIAGVLETDLANQARAFAERGPLAVFGDLHGDVRWRADAVLEVGNNYEADVTLDGRGLLLIPAAFIWPGVGAMIDPPWQPSLIYPPRGLGSLWEPARDRGSPALDDLLGARRARILTELAAPATTAELAARLRASRAGVSEHLTTLRRAGLLSARRDGRSVLYVRTEAGDALLRAASR